ncbi:O-antigen ligase family protein [Candidatus Calescamantes bacterium]|nr:O-antigen ligase family protein [Candidatus Calescamantes bacterium]
MVHNLYLIILFFILWLRPLISGVVYPSTNFLYLIFFSLLGVVILYEKWRLKRLGREERLWLLLLLWCFASLIWSVNRHSTLSVFSLFLTNFYVIYLVKRLKKKEKEILIWTILTASVIVSINGIYQYFWGLEKTREYVYTFMDVSKLSPDFLTRLQTQRAFSTFVYPNAFAGYLIIFIPLSLFYSFKWRKRWKALLLFIATLLLFTLFLTKSKGGIIALVLSLSTLGFLKLPRRRKAWALGGIIVLVIVLVSSPTVRKLAQQSFGVRVSYWKAGIRMIREKPLTGFGLGTYGRVFTRFKVPGREETRMAHNNYLQILTETGFVGSFLFYLFLLSFLLKLLQKRNDPLIEGILGGYLAFLFHSWVDFDLYVPGIVIPLFALLGVGDEEEKMANFKLASLCLVFLFLFLLPLNLRIVNSYNFADQAKIKIEKGEIKEAMDLLDKSLKFYPWGEDVTGVSYHFHKGELYLTLAKKEKNQKLIKKAIEEIRKAIQLDPYRFFYWEKLAMIYFSMGDVKKALEFIDKALYCYPSHPRLQGEKKKIENSLKGGGG